MGSLHIQNSTYVSGDQKMQFVENLGFWQPLMAELLPFFTEVEIHCCTEEKEGIHLVRPFAKTIRTENSMVIFTMPLTYRLRELILNSVIQHHSIVWFSLFFKRYGKDICSVEHNGAELHFFSITYTEAKTIQNLFPKETVFHFKD